MIRCFTVLGSAAGLLAVAAGAFAAHGLEAHLEPGRLEVFELAARYQMYHALALLAAAWAADRFGGKLTAAAGWLFLAGIIVFCGSLYLLALTEARWWGAITPIGGVAFILGWLLLLLGSLRSTRAGR